MFLASRRRLRRLEDAERRIAPMERGRRALVGAARDDVDWARCQREMCRALCAEATMHDRSMFANASRSAEANEMVAQDSNEIPAIGVARRRDAIHWRAIQLVYPLAHHHDALRICSRERPVQLTTLSRIHKLLLSITETAIGLTRKPYSVIVYGNS